MCCYGLGEPGLSCALARNDRRESLSERSTAAQPPVCRHRTKGARYERLLSSNIPGATSWPATSLISLGTTCVVSHRTHSAHWRSRFAAMKVARPDTPRSAERHPRDRLRCDAPRPPHKIRASITGGNRTAAKVGTRAANNPPRETAALGVEEFLVVAKLERELTRHEKGPAVVAARPVIFHRFPVHTCTVTHVALPAV